MCLTGFIHIS